MCECGELLLTRDKFREAVFKRDNYKCVVCKKPAIDAHHIIERRLFSCFGYHISNGVSLCSEHHIISEQTHILPSDLRYFAGITKIIVPPHLYDDHEYDKWGNHIMANGMRCKGELFYDESVQKILAPVLHLFTSYVKYPRTFHLPWSPGIHDDDRALSLEECRSNFKGKEIVVTIKLDGENTSLYTNYIHARSLDSKNHESRNWIKNFHRTFAHDIPKGWRINMENCYAEHSIKYRNLEAYAYGFAIWDNNNRCLDWDRTLEWFELLSIIPVPTIYEGIWDEELLRKLYSSTRNGDDCEGYVVRLRDGFGYGDFRKSVAKYVRQGHVQTVKHWLTGQAMVKNQLKLGD